MGWRVGMGVGIDAALLASTHQPNPQDDHGEGRHVASRREQCLNEALECVTKDRAKDYGSPEDNFSNIAEMWNSQGVRIDGRVLVASDVALLMAGMKLARLRFNPAHEDSWVDLAGYAACGMDVSGEDKPVSDEGVKGWVTGNSCQYRDSAHGRIGCVPHGAHTYDNNAYWCDGYV